MLDVGLIADRGEWSIETLAEFLNGGGWRVTRPSPSRITLDKADDPCTIFIYENLDAEREYDAGEMAVVRARIANPLFVRAHYRERLCLDELLRFLRSTSWIAEDEHGNLLSMDRMIQVLNGE